VFYHGAHIVLTQRNTELGAQQVDLKRTMVISGDGLAALVVNVAEIHRSIGIPGIKGVLKQRCGGLTITIAAFGVVKSHREFP
jgi:hypothetical protein